MRTDGLFQKGVSPTPEMRAKLCAAQKRRWAERQDDRWLVEFLAKVQALLDETYARMKLQ